LSKAFTDEEAEELPAVVRPRAPLPAGVLNYVTPRGLAALRDELAELAAERTRAEALANAKERGRALGALARRRAELEERIATAELVAPPSGARDVVRFGASVRVATAGGERRYRIVGVDEADAAGGALAFTSPLGRALLGRRCGDMVRLRAPRGEEELEILAVDYEPG
jgi:transcription elongation factor GreB